MGKKRKMAKKAKVDKVDKKGQKRKLFLEVYRQKLCNISITCQAIGISRQVYYNWRKRYPDFDQGCKDTEISLVDMAESQLFKNLREGKETSLIFFLKSRKPDVYGEKKDLYLKGKFEIEPLVVRIDGSKPSRIPGKDVSKR